MCTLRTTSEFVFQSVQSEQQIENVDLLVLSTSVKGVPWTHVGGLPICAVVVTTAEESPWGIGISPFGGALLNIF